MIASFHTGYCVGCIVIDDVDDLVTNVAAKPTF